MWLLILLQDVYNLISEVHVKCFNSLTPVLSQGESEGILQEFHLLHPDKCGHFFDIT